MDKQQKETVNILKNGGIVIFPTDTAFGIGCRIDDEKAAGKLFEIRRRPETKATPVLVSGLEMAKNYWLDVPDIVVEKLIKPYWPGALTIVLPCKTEKVPDLVRGGGDTLGLRMPDSSLIQEIIKEVGVPIIGTSANFAGGPSPYKFEDLDPELVKLVDYVLQFNSHPRPDRGSMDSRLRGNDNISTVIDCSTMPWKILRNGAIKISI
ncbi:MAG TPA: L-threonylcarbamoyladenylate synthase [Xanthomonadales bacterium]|nr:L-threonylcarbamoyladenylate synthase [Xanthomonadales bacterium]